MEKVEFRIEGVSALLMHSYPLVPIEALEKKTPQEQAEIAAYRIPSKNGARGNLYVPGTALWRALVAAGVYSKGKGRGNLSQSVAACVAITPEYLDLGTADYVVDTRPVVIPATKGRILRYRPRLDAWSVSGVLLFDPNMLTVLQVRRIVDDAGSKVGILDFRPAKKGPFGRFQVVAWKHEK